MTTQDKFFKVKYGFNPADQVSIPETDLEKAIYAQVKGTPTQLGNAFINGKNIISITPHWHRHTGWNDFYEPESGADFEQIKRDCPNYDGVIEKYKQRVVHLIDQGKERLIGKNVPIPELVFSEVKTLQAHSNEAAQIAGKFKVDINA